MKERTRPDPPSTGRWSAPVARIQGVTIRVHVTFLALVLLVALSAADAGESVVLALAWLVVLFACVVAHELAHALVARSKGIAVHEIDLLPIGGVSRLERIPDDWRDELAIAAAGPIASASIALGSLVLAAAAGQALLPATLWEGPLLVRMGWVNLMLAGFNLVPAFPLDGGRVLRAGLERTRSRVEATRVAAGISRVLAGAMIGFGFLFNLWLFIIGLFVLVAGRAEEAAVLIHAALEPTPARALAVPCPVVLPSDMVAADGVVVAGLHPQVAYPVVEPSGHLLGVVNLGALRGAPPTTPLRDLAFGTSVDESESLEDVAERISHGAVAVTRDGRPVGVITLELLNAYVAQRLHEAGT